MSWTGFIINFFSGLALFVPRGIKYVGDPAFLGKILLVTLGVAITARLQRLLSHRSSDRDIGALWFSVGIHGRLITFFG